MYIIYNILSILYHTILYYTVCVGAGGRVTKGGQPRKKMIRRSGPKSSASEAVLGDGGTATVKRTSKKINYGGLRY